jgi:nucleotidyltransferase substrate binding protein (TIGR01987 family)
MPLDLTGLENGVNSLREAIAVYHEAEKLNLADAPVLKVLRAGVIQNFEITYELSWKMMKRWLEKNVRADLVSGKPQIELYRRAAEYGLIADVDDWMRFHRARNQTSHVYGEALAAEILILAVFFCPFAETLSAYLEANNP